MPQEKVVVRSLQEYPNTTVWKDYAVRCPLCNRLTEDYGEVETLIQDEWFQLCNPCGNETQVVPDTHSPHTQEPQWLT